MRKIPAAVFFVMPVLVAACIAVPYDYGDEELLQDADLTFIVVGETNKDQVEAAMASIRVREQEKRRFTFSECDCTGHE